jgi:hypothetical protein
MKSLGILITSVAGSIAICASGAESVLLSGNSLGNPHQLEVLAGLGYDVTVVSPFDYGKQDLSGYGAIWLDGFSQYSPGTPGNPGLSAASLVSFMNAGGTVFIENPGFGSESLGQFPFGAELINRFENHDTIRITDSLNPLFAGVTSAGLSNWGNPASSTGAFDSNTGSFQGIADSGTAGEWITLEKEVGAGRLIYTDQIVGRRIESANSPLNSSEVQFLNNALAVPVPEPSSIALFVFATFALVASRRGIRR